MKKIIPIFITVFALASCNAKEIEVVVTPIEANNIIQPQIVTDWLAQEEYDYAEMKTPINARTDLGDNLPIHFDFESTSNSKAYYVFIQEEGKEVNEAVKVDNNAFDFINYKINTRYTIWVNTSNNPKNNKNAYSFTTPDSYFRTITIDKVNNFRDLGDGRIMKQGMIYRSATFENNESADEENPWYISDLGKEQIKALNLKSEIDLRKDDEKKCVDSSYIGLKYLKAPLHYGGENILTYNKDENNNPLVIKNIFAFLGMEANYPIDFHCMRGTDRTGCIAFLIKGLLGYDWEALYRDYLFSNFYNIGSSVKKDNVYYSANPNVSTRYGNVIDHAEGETLQEKIYNYLSSDKVGVSTTTLDNIINILKA